MARVVGWRQMTDQRVPVLLYDGKCGLCNGVVRFILRHDPNARIHFAPLQSAPAQEFLRSEGLPADDFDSLVFVPDWGNPERGAHLLRTGGAMAALAELGGAWRMVSWLRLLPAFLRDPAYRLVARSRYALFGEYKPAPLPDPEWEKRFLAR
jgi:predicted DCC family thiol-disulfide oxidoreductase YuxK